jgi:DNA-directed RNA polymerase
LKLEIANKAEFNTRKQSRAFMPNLIHSLDASSLALLIDFYFKDGNINFFSIHDCFAVPCNNVTKIISFLKLSYWNIYTKEPFLKTFHDKFVENLKTNLKIEVKTENKKTRISKKNKDILNNPIKSCYKDVTYFKVNINSVMTRFNIPDINMVITNDNQFQIPIENSSYLII